MASDERVIISGFPQGGQYVRDFVSEAKLLHELLATLVARHEGDEVTIMHTEPGMSTLLAMEVVEVPGGVKVRVRR